MSVPEPHALKPSTITVLHSSQTKHIPGIFLQKPFKEALVAFAHFTMKKLRLMVAKRVRPGDKREKRRQANCRGRGVRHKRRRLERNRK